MTATERSDADRALERVHAAIEKAVQPDSLVTPSMETEVHNALLVLKRSGCGAEILQRVERIAATLFLMARARANGRPNLYDSQRLRLRQI